MQGWLTKELASNPDLRNKLIRGFKLSFWIAATFIAMQILIGLKFTFYKDLNPNITTSDGTRYPGFFADAQVNAQYLGMLSFLFLINFKNIKKTCFGKLRFIQPGADNAFLLRRPIAF